MTHRETALGQDFDLVVVGSGFGGAAVACRLAQAGRRVAILERGKEYPLGRGEITKTGHGTRTIRHGHFQVDVGVGMSVIRGIGVGGGSLHYFGVRLRADAEIFERPPWPSSITRRSLDPYYDLAGDMLEASPLEPSPVLGFPVRAEAFMKAARHCRRCREAPYPVPLAVHSGELPEPTAAGVPRTRCVYCGECILGCPASESFAGSVNARNLLTLNYLAVARQTGRATIFPEHFVDRVRTSGDGFEVDVTLRDSGADAADGPQAEEGWATGTVRARQVVLAAGTMGSNEILLKSRPGLPPMSERLGLGFSGNGDFLLARTRNAPQDLQPTAGPSIVVGGDFSTDDNRIFIEDLGKIPFMGAVFGLREETPPDVDRHELAYLGMGTDAANGVLKVEEGLIRLLWDPKPSLPLYREIIAALREMSQQLGGDYADPEGYNPVVGTGLVTAHPLGGCSMAERPEEGVVDARGEVFGVPGLFVADGSIVPTALATNPSYTISALAERVAFHMIHGREMRDGDPETPANA